MIVSFRNRLFIGFSLAIALSAVSGVISYRIFQKQATQRQWVKSTHHIIDSAKTLQALMIDMEAGQRAFRATGQQKFLEHYNDAAPHIAPLIRDLKDSLIDNAEDEARAVELEKHVDTLIRFWAGTTEPSATDADAGISIANANNGAYSRADAARITANEKAQMDQVRTMITGIEKNETKLFTIRRDEYENLIHEATRSTAVGSILSELIIIILIIIVSLEFRRRRIIQEQLKTSVSKLEQQTKELRASEEEQKRAFKEVEAVNKQLEKFVYTVAHDIKSPLAGISGSLSILEMEDAIATNPDLAEFVHLSRDRVKFLTDMVNSILEYSRTTLGHQPVELVDTGQLVQGITHLMLPPQNMKITITGPMPVLKTSRIKIMEVFQNLISNAIKYNNKKEGRIEIGSADKGDFWQFYVTDNGIGISDENKPLIFSIFREVQQQPMRESSTGFGLNIVKLIVEEQGGTIWVDSVPGEGSTSYFLWKK